MFEHTDLDLLSVDLYDIGLFLFGLIVLLAVLLPRFASRQMMITAPMLYLAFGALLFLLPWAPELPGLMDSVGWAKRLTELGVIIALTSAGLKLNRPYKRETWQISWRLLAITMPLTIAAAAFLGWWAAGFVPATALLLGAVIAPTDPVLASDVQTSEPDKPDDSKVRLALTTEAGLNDGLAFPFTNLAILVAVAGLTPSEWIVGWLVVDVFYKIVAGTLVGAVCGWILAKLIFQLPSETRLAKTMTGIAVISLTLLTYGLAEILSSYGFISVFVAACVFRQYECDNEYNSAMHDLAEEAERLLTVFLMILVGAYVSSGLMSYMTPTLWLLALGLVLIVRPIAGILGLIGTDLPNRKRWAISFLGIRGIGSIYYLAYALHHADFPDAMVIWALVVAIVIISVIVHGITAAPIMKWVKARDERK
jgi:sodium/hydrogen antiporter